MQEEQTVSFQPVSNCGPQPWYIELFGLFILVLVAVFMVRVVKLTINLRKLRKARTEATPVAVVDGLWTDCYVKAHSLKDISALTFLVSMLTFTWHAADVILALRVQKIVSASYAIGRLSDGFVALGLGLVFCVVLYSTAMFSEAVLRRRKSRWAATGPTLKKKPQPPVK